VSDSEPAAESAPAASPVRRGIAKVLAGIAPEADLTTVPPEANLRQELDLDSVDFQNFLSGLAKALGREIPADVAGDLTTIAACERFFEKPA